MRRLLLALAVLVVLPASTEAAPPWSAPRDVSGPHTFVDGLWAGDGLIGWRSEDGEAGAPAGRSVDPVFFGDGQAAVAIVAAGRLETATRAPSCGWRSARGGRFGPSRRVRQAPADRAADARRQRARRPRARVVRGPRHRRTTASRRAAPRRPRVRRADPARHAAACAACRSRSARAATCSWPGTRAGKVAHAAASAAATGSARAETLRSDPAFFAELRTAVASSGRAYVAWAAQCLTEGGDRGPGLLRGRVRARPAPRASAARSGSSGSRAGHARSARSTSRSPAAATRSSRGPSDRVRAAETGAHGRFGAPRDLSAPGAVSDDDSRRSARRRRRDPAGARLVTWTATAPLLQAAFARPAARSARRRTSARRDPARRPPRPQRGRGRFAGPTGSMCRRRRERGRHPRMANRVPVPRQSDDYTRRGRRGPPRLPRASRPAPRSSTSAPTRSTPPSSRATSSTSPASPRSRSGSPARCSSTASTPRASSTSRWRPPRARSSPPTTAA